MKKANAVLAIIESAKAIILDNNLICYPSTCHKPESDDETIISFYENDECGWATEFSMNQLNNATVKNGDLIINGNIKYDDDVEKNEEDEFLITVLTNLPVSEVELS